MRSATQIAITGIGCRFPGRVCDPESFWQFLKEGHDAVAEIPADRWPVDDDSSAAAMTRGKQIACAGFLDRIDQFDAEFFGVGSREASHMDPQHRLLLEVTWEALERAGLPVERLQGSMTGVYVGISNDDYRLLHMGQAEAIDAYSATGTVHSFAANRISYLLDLRGPSLAVDATCASSLVAVHLACQSLSADECDAAIAGAVNLILAPVSMLATAKVVTSAGDWRCKTFDARADGIVRGEGCGVVILKRLADALAAGDPIWAVIEGSAVNQDGRSNGMTAPNPAAQEAVIRRALAVAGVAPHEIDYIEAHGTGTPLGDPIEMEGLSSIFTHPLLVGSVKTNLGHLEAAAGMAGLIKTVLALKEKAIPPHLHLHTLNPMVAEFAHDFDIPLCLRDWPTRHGIRRAGVSAFSLGGTNAHVVLSSAPEIDRPLNADPTSSSAAQEPLLLGLSAASHQALEERARRLADWLVEQASQLEWSHVCYTSDVRRTHYRYRLAVVADSSANAAQLLAHRLENVTKHLTRDEQGFPSGLVFVFPGQAEDWSRAGKELLGRDSSFAASLKRSDEFLRKATGWSLIEELNEPNGVRRSDVAQAVILAQQLAIVDMLEQKGIKPAAVVGHSLGEVAAACVAGVLRREDAFAMLLKRGGLVQAISGRGCMAALRLDAARAQALTSSLSGQVSIAAINSQSSVVISGDSEGMKNIHAKAEQEGLAWLSLPGAFAFHSPQILPLLPAFTEATRSLEHQRPECAMYSTVTGSRMENAPGAAHWAHNLADPVRFADAIMASIRDGYRHYVEIGPRRVLCKHISEMLEGAGVAGYAAPILRGRSGEWASVLQTIGEIYELGYDIRWQSFYPERRPLLSLPSYPWQRKRYWLNEETEFERLWRVDQIDGSFWHPSSVHAGNEWVFSLAGYLGVGLKAWFKNDGSLPVRFRRFEVHQKMMWSGQHEVTTRATLARRSDGCFKVRVNSRREGGEHWEQNAEGEMLLVARENAVTGIWRIEEIQARLQQKEVGELRTKLSAAGSQCAALARVVHLSLSASEVFAEISVSPDQGIPGLLDLCVQLGALPCVVSSGPVLAVGFETATVWADDPGARVWIHGINRRETEKTWIADVEARDAAGRILVGFRCVRLRQVLSPGLLYHLAWEPLPDELPVRQDMARIDPAVRISSGDAIVYTEARAQIDDLCAHYAAEVLRRLSELGVADALRRFDPVVKALSRMAREAVQSIDPRTLSSRLEQQFPVLGIELELLNKCAMALPDVLTGRTDALHPIFEGNSAHRIYRASPFARYWNAAVKNVVLEAIACCGADARIRILEVGAGTGGTTAALLPYLPAERVEYWFTDISGAFLNRARKEFDRFPFLRYARFDLACDPKTQGFQERNFDIILAANCVHTTSDRKLALRGLRSLASPGGKLILLEGTSNRRWADLTFGATKGWFQSDGNDPLLEPEAWARFAADEGWEQASTIARGPGELAAIVVAQAPRRLSRNRWVVLGEPSGGAGEIAAVLGAHHQEVVVAEKLEDTAASAGEPAGVLDCRYMSSGQSEGASAVEELCKMAVETVRALARRPWQVPPQLWLLTRNALRPTNPGELAQSAIHGLGRVLFTEYQEFAGGLIDLDNHAADGCDRVWEILQRRGQHSDDWFSIRDGRTRAARIQHSPAPEEGREPVSSRGTYLITGGFGGIGLHLAEWLAKQGAKRIVLVSRRIPEDAVLRLRHLTEAGVELLMKTADVADLEQLSSLLHQVADPNRPLRGVVHAAGVAHDGVIANLDSRDLDEVLRPKVTGAWNLHTLTRGMPLDLFILCSSAATWIGMAGLGAYAAANAFLDGLATYRRECGLAAQVIDWGGWRNTGMAERVGDQRQHQWSARGLHLMTPEDALAAFQQTVQGSAIRTGIASVNWAEFLNTFSGRKTPGLYQNLAESFVESRPHGHSEPVPQATNLHRRLRQTPLSERPAVFYKFLHRQLSALLTGPLPDHLPPERSIVEFGLDSLMEVEIRNALATALGVQLPVTVVLDYPTPRTLLEYTADLCGLELPSNGRDTLAETEAWPLPIRI